MKRLLFLLLAAAALTLYGEVPTVPGSASPDGKYVAVLDVDRDPKIDPKWDDDSLPQIEITEQATRKIVASIPYFGSPGSDARPLREHVELMWRADSKAFGLTINDRFYSTCDVYVFNPEGRFTSVPFPTYEQMTGFPAPDAAHLRPRGRNQVEGWDAQGHLILSTFLSPLPTFTGRDPLKHRVFLQVTPAGMIVQKVENEKGHWSHGDWILDKK